MKINIKFTSYQIIKYQLSAIKCNKALKIMPYDVINMKNERNDNNERLERRSVP